MYHLYWSKDAQKKHKIVKQVTNQPLNSIIFPYNSRSKNFTIIRNIYSPKKCKLVKRVVKTFCAYFDQYGYTFINIR